MPASASDQHHGLFRLYPSTYFPENCIADIVALHGLGGHPYNTWTDADGHLWLRDSLPARIPQTRIMTFGYDSAVVFSRSRLTINDFALDLLERLRLARKLPVEQQRPLVFVCHSLGGVLFKEMLIQASLDTSNHGQIARCVKGVVFVGTPHRGSKSASQAQILSKIINTATLGSGVRSDLLKSLQVSSPELETISRHAIQLLKAISIVSFYERKPLGLGVIVEPFSAILGLPNERAVPINADHRKIAKISPQKMDRYLPIPEAIAELVEETQSNTSPLRGAEKLEDLSRKLFCADYTSSQLRVRQAHPGTCDWVFGDSAYLSWAHSRQSDILMLTGGPGTGKSVLTRFILESVLSGAQESQLATSYQGVGFFCSYLNSEHLQYAQSTVLRSLLHQFIQLSPRCEVIVKNRLLVRRAGVLSYDMAANNLWTALQEVLALDIMRFTFIAIDALEELGTDAAVWLVSGLYNIVSTLNRSSSGTHCIKILISSRHDPTLMSAIPSLTFLKIPQHQVTNGIKIYLQDNVENLAATAAGFNACADAKLRQEIVESISARADGMFLWATVVWDDFTRILLWNTSAIRAKLAGIKKSPSRISALYEQLIQKIDPDFREDVFLILAIISVAGRPLRISEIAIVLSVAKTEHPIESSSDLDLIHGLESTIQGNFPDLITFHDDHTVTLAHLSLGEYLQTLWANEGGVTPRRAQRVIARSCLKYLKLKDLMDDIASRRISMADVEAKYPFLEYAKTYLEHHLWKIPVHDPLWLLFADLAGPSGSCKLGLLGKNTSFLFGWRPWNEYPGRSPLFMVVAGIHKVSDAATLIKEFANHGYDLNETWQLPADRGSPLSWCLWQVGSVDETRKHDYKGLVRLLLKLGAHPDPSVGRCVSNFDLVVRAKCWDILDIMIRHPQCNPSHRDEQGRYILHFLVEHGAQDVLQKFLDDYDIDINIQDITGSTPLHVAAAKGNEAIVRTLLNVYSIRPDLTDQYGRTPLTVATYWGLQRVALVFLEHSQAFPTPEVGKMSALCFSAKHGQLEMCRKLLEACKYKNLERHLDESGKGICHHAAINNWTHLLRLCLGANGVMANQIDHSGGTPLHVAARLGNTESCQVLIAHGANVRLQDRLGRTAAQIAADAGFGDTLMAILDSGTVDPNQWDHQGRNLVHWVATVDSTVVMRRVLDLPGVEIARRDRYGAMPIQIAERCKSANVGKLLAKEMERRGLNPAWYAGYAWDLMYRSPEVDIEQEEERLRQARASYVDPYTDSRHKEWEEVARKYPEAQWGLVVVEPAPKKPREVE
ncbi:hypothetical protein V8F20_012226 [Naviculisporaceae sp. PSN 640]